MWFLHVLLIIKNPLKLLDDHSFLSYYNRKWAGVYGRICKLCKKCHMQCKYTYLFFFHFIDNEFNQNTLLHLNGLQ